MDRTLLAVLVTCAKNKDLNDLWYAAYTFELLHQR